MFGSFCSFRPGERTRRGLTLSVSGISGKVNEATYGKHGKHGNRLWPNCGSHHLPGEFLACSFLKCELRLISAYFTSTVRALRLRWI